MPANNVLITLNGSREKLSGFRVEGFHESPVGRKAQLVVTFSNVYIVEGHLLISP